MILFHVYFFIFNDIFGGSPSPSVREKKYRDAVFIPHAIPELLYPLTEAIFFLSGNRYCQRLLLIMFYRIWKVQGMSEKEGNLLSWNTKSCWDYVVTPFILT